MGEERKKERERHKAETEARMTADTGLDQRENVERVEVTGKGRIGSSLDLSNELGRGVEQND